MATRNVVIDVQIRTSVISAGLAAARKEAAALLQDVEKAQARSGKSVQMGAIGVEKQVAAVKALQQSNVELEQAVKRREAAERALEAIDAKARANAGKGPIQEVMQERKAARAEAASARREVERVQRVVEVVEKRVSAPVQEQPVKVQPVQESDSIPVPMWMQAKRVLESGPPKERLKQIGELWGQKPEEIGLAMVQRGMDPQDLERRKTPTPIVRAFIETSKRIEQNRAKAPPVESLPPQGPRPGYEAMTEFRQDESTEPTKIEVVKVQEQPSTQAVKPRDTINPSPSITALAQPLSRPTALQPNHAEIDTPLPGDTEKTGLGAPDLYGRGMYGKGSVGSVNRYEQHLRRLEAELPGMQARNDPQAEVIAKYLSAVRGALNNPREFAGVRANPTVIRPGNVTGSDPQESSTSFGAHEAATSLPPKKPPAKPVATSPEPDEPHDAKTKLPGVHGQTTILPTVAVERQSVAAQAQKPPLTDRDLMKAIKGLGFKSETEFQRAQPDLHAQMRAEVARGEAEYRASFDRGAGPEVLSNRATPPNLLKQLQKGTMESLSGQQALEALYGESIPPTKQAGRLTMFHAKQVLGMEDERPLTPINYGGGFGGSGGAYGPWRPPESPLEDIRLFEKERIAGDMPQRKLRTPAALGHEITKTMEERDYAESARGTDDLSERIRLTRQLVTEESNLQMARLSLFRESFHEEEYNAMLRSRLDLRTSEARTLKERALVDRNQIGSASHISVMREEMLMRKEMARNDRMERRVGLQVEYGRMGAELTLLSENLQTVGRVAGWAFGVGTAGIAGMVRAGSPVTWNTLTGSFRLLAGEIGQTMMPAMLGLSQKAQDVYHWFRQLSPETRSTIGNITVGAVAAAGGLWLTVRAVTALATAFRGVSAAASFMGLGSVGRALAGGGGMIAGMSASAGAAGGILTQGAAGAAAGGLLGRLGSASIFGLGGTLAAGAGAYLGIDMLSNAIRPNAPTPAPGTSLAEALNDPSMTTGFWNVGQRGTFESPTAMRARLLRESFGVDPRTVQRMVSSGSLGGNSLSPEAIQTLLRSANQDTSTLSGAQSRARGLMVNMDYAPQQMAIESLHDYIQNTSIRSPLGQEVFEQQMRELRDLFTRFGDRLFSSMPGMNPGATP